MPSVDINWWALLAATVINMLIGFVWYSPTFFAKPWAKYNGLKLDKLDDGNTSRYWVTTLGAFIQAFVLLHFVSYASYFYPTYNDVSVGVITAVWAWIGFVAIPQGFNTLFENRRKKLWAINTGYSLVVLIINGILLAAWH